MAFLGLFFTIWHLGVIFVFIRDRSIGWGWPNHLESETWMKGDDGHRNVDFGDIFHQLRYSQSNSQNCTVACHNIRKLFKVFVPPGPLCCFYGQNYQKWSKLPFKSTLSHFCTLLEHLWPFLKILINVHIG